MTVTEAFQNIIKETCRILNCDRASVFLIDKRKNILWTKLAKSSKPIQVEMGKGIVGYVAKHKETVNILDAHVDNRFDSKADIANHYRTRTVLCVPIWMNSQPRSQTYLSQTQSNAKEHQGINPKILKSPEQTGELSKDRDNILKN